MKLKLLLTLGCVLLSACILHAVDNVIVLKSKDGQTVILEHELAQQSETLKDMRESELLALQPKDEAGNPVMEFNDFDINQLRMAQELLKFAQLHPTIEFPKDPTLEDRKAYQNKIEQVVAEFKQQYPNKDLYPEIFVIADFFAIPAIIQVIGQGMLTPALDLKMLEQNKYYPNHASFEDAIARQMKRRIDLEKELYLAREIGKDADYGYFKGFSVQNLIDHGRISVNPEIIYGKRRLNLSYKNLCSLEGLDKLFDKHLLGTIEVLKLDGNKFTSIPDNVYGMNVQNIDLSSNEIEDIPVNITGWNNLIELNLAFNNIRRFPTAIHGLGKLKVLYLQGNKIEDIPSNIIGLGNLIELDLAFNNIRKFPTAIHGLEKLKALYLQRNKIEDIPNVISGFDALTNLNLSSNNIADIPENITGLPLLRRLGLDKNPIAQYQYFNKVSQLMNNLSKTRDDIVRIDTK